MPRRDAEEVFECEAEVDQITDLAVLVVTEAGDKDWIPKSLLRGGEIDEDAVPGTSGELCIPLWKAAELGWV